jgi:hypothetical protein
MNLFGLDGSLVATSTVAPSPSLGVWRHLDGQIYRAKFRFFRYGSGGVFEGVQQVTRRIKMADNGNAFTSKVSIEMFDLSDTVFNTLCGNETATRVF